MAAKQNANRGNGVEVSDEWRRWIAENLMLGNPAASIVDLLEHNGVLRHKAQAEVDAAARSPYLGGAIRLLGRVAKRDWVLNIQSKLERLDPVDIPRRDKLSGDEFLRDFYSRNRPVIITGMLDDCRARTEWSFEFLKEKFGDREVEVQFGRDADANYEINSVAHKRTLRFGDYVDMVRDSKGTNDFYMTATNDSKNRQVLAELWDDMPQLPEYLQTNQSGAGFLWFGPKGTLTPFHHDLTNNFMSQIIGRKRLRLVAPFELANMANHRHCFTTIDARNIDYDRFPAMRNVSVLDCVLEAGEILFLPVGWWHFVEGLETSITISATNFKWNNDFFSNYPKLLDY